MDNKIILRLEPKNYIIEGEMIFTFSKDGEIEKLNANKGNNCSAYPVACSKINIFSQGYEVYVTYNKIDDGNDRNRLIAKDTSSEP